MATIAVDFDCLKAYKAKENVESLAKWNHLIVVYSKHSNLDDVIKFIDTNKLPITEVTSTFPECDLFISPKAARFDAWNLTIASLPWNLPENVGGKKAK